MIINENEFFRQATLRICGNLDFEYALQDCLIYLRAFMPADCLQMTLFDQGLSVLRTIAIATPNEARRDNIIIPLDEESLKNVNRGKNRIEPSSYIIDTEPTALSKAIISATGIWEDHSCIIMQLAIRGEKLGNIVLYARGIKQYTEEHMRLFSVLNEPFAIALSNALRYDEVNRLKDMMEDDIKYLHNRLQNSDGETVIGEDFGLKNVMDMVGEVAPLDSPVLLLGETGVGKEIIANRIHRMSKRRDGPFIQVNCGAIPDTLLDSELFGHERGAFTGAIALKRGCFERADGGTIFLDEVAELPLQAQVRMLRVLQQKEIIRVGGSRQVGVDIRIIAATHEDLKKMVRDGSFRTDLQFRLNVFPITIPPLRDRKEDIPALVHYFIEKKSKELQAPAAPSLAPGAINVLMDYEWPGNVRELENVLERALILSKGKPLSFNEILSANKTGKSIEYLESTEIFPNLDHVNSTHIKKALMMTKGRVHGPNGAAGLLGINASTLRHRMTKLGISYGRGSYK